MILENLKPFARYLKYSGLYTLAKGKAKFNSKIVPRNMAFIIGAGRSGTTILGKILSSHQRAKYFFEPYHLWAAVDICTDCLNLFHSGDAKIILDEVDLTLAAKERFNRLFRASHEDHLILEKTPLNAMRIGYLEALLPQAKYIHIVRDGIEVSYSIERLATGNYYRIWGKPSLNQWWGTGYSKWNFLKSDGLHRGYFPESLNSITTFGEMGAYEWLVSLMEVERWRQKIENRLYEVQYDNLLKDPLNELQGIFDFLSLGVSQAYLKSAAQKLYSGRKNSASTLAMPHDMSEAFNYYQDLHGFLGRAVSKNHGS